ncbi:MAG TPA: SdpI family protein, partial [Gemmatimonadales bacterium]|nr:SdpI family protein [Gemmatimonadales bacterium]
VIAAGVFGIISMDRLPEQVATHWNFSGQADGWSGRGTAVFLLPGIGLVLAVLLAVFPRLDPKRANFELHAAAWWLLGNAVLVFMAVLHLFVIGNGLGWPVRIDQVIGYGCGGLLLLLGNYFSRIRQNWFMGIRTPWTLSSEKSWRETHRLGGKLFMAGGLLLIVGTAVSGRLSSWFTMAGVLVPAIITVIYSYLVWRNDPEAEGHSR